MTPSEQLAEDRAWLEREAASAERAARRIASGDVRDPRHADRWLNEAEFEAARWRRILAVLSAQQEQAGALGRVEAEMDALKSRGSRAVRCLQAIDPHASPDIIMYGVRDALRALNQISTPDPHPSTVATPAQEQATSS